jgi:hypothetical protein
MIGLSNFARRIRNDANTIASLTQFFCSKLAGKVVVPLEPHFDEQSRAVFSALLSRAQTYLEYGSGGSTQLAARYAKTVVSVDNDSAFLEEVGRRIYKERRRAEFEPILVNIGISGPWGFPVFTERTDDRLRRWKTYPTAPWRFLQQRMLEPDVILVDGRFRVACVLESLLHLRPKSACDILVDDYAERAHYKIIEEFCDLISMHGRMAHFRRPVVVDVEQCRQALEHFYGDFR